MGKLIENEISCDGVQMLPVLQEDERNEIIKKYDFVLVATHLAFLSGCRKHHHQKGMFQHSYKIENPSWKKRLRS